MNRAQRTTSKRCNRVASTANDHQDVKIAGEIFIRRDSVERLVTGVRRLKKLTKRISDADLKRWCRIVARFERNSFWARQQFARPDVLTYLAATLNTTAVKAERRHRRKILVRQAGVRSLLST
jgi:hypothetical protein